MRIGAPALACACVLVLHAGEASQALWPGSRYTEQDHDHAVERGLRFISKIAGDPKAFARWGHAKCEKCGTAVELESRYEVWLDALIRTHTGDLYGVKLGASYDDVLRWIKWMRPYPSFKKADSEDAFYAAYAVTHLIYTLNDYHTYRLSPAWLPVEFQYLKRNLPRSISQKDPEMLGEFMDTLRAFGMSEKDALMRRAVQYELSHQNADGSWGDVQSEDLYTRYHSTWTVVDGLRDYQFLGEQLRRPEVIDIINPRAAGKW